MTRFLAEAEQIQRLFGSQTVTAAADPAYHAGGVPRPPRALLEAWRAEPWRRRLDEATVERIERLLGHTGGRLVFYDAVPLSREPDLLQPDLLNPHYRDYYSSEGGDTPPSDDQSPVPVSFLAVRPDVCFAFSYRVRPATVRRERRPEGEAAGRKAAAQVVDDETEALAALQRWLEEGLTTEGAGAKTAAGYGYFHTVRHLAPEEAPARLRARIPPQARGETADSSSPRARDFCAGGSGRADEDPAISRPRLHRPRQPVRAAPEVGEKARPASKPLSKDDRVRVPADPATAPPPRPSPAAALPPPADGRIAAPCSCRRLYPVVRLDLPVSHRR